MTLAAACCCQRLQKAIARTKLASGWYDGEVVMLNDKGVADFGAVQQFVGAAKTSDIVLHLFDRHHRQASILYQAEGSPAFQELGFKALGSQAGLIGFTIHERAPGTTIRGRLPPDLTGEPRRALRHAPIRRQRVAG